MCKLAGPKAHSDHQNPKKVALHGKATYVGLHPQLVDHFTPLFILQCQLHCHAIKSLNKITKTRHKIHLINNNSDNGGSDGGFIGSAAGFRRARRRPDRMADKPPDPH